MSSAKHSPGSTLVAHGILGFFSVLALAPIVGPAWAGVILLIAALVLAGLLGWAAIHHIAGPREKAASTEALP